MAIIRVYVATGIARIANNYGVVKIGGTIIVMIKSASILNSSIRRYRAVRKCNLAAIVVVNPATYIARRVPVNHAVRKIKDI